jgi:hypothetical protein
MTVTPVYTKKLTVPINATDPFGLAKCGRSWTSPGDWLDCMAKTDDAVDAALPVVHDAANAVGAVASVCAAATSATVVGALTCGGISLGASAVSVGTGSVLYAEGRISQQSLMLDGAGAMLSGAGTVLDVGAGAARGASLSWQARSDALFARALSGPLLGAPIKAFFSGVASGVGGFWKASAQASSGVSRLLSGISFGLSLSGVC